MTPYYSEPGVELYHGDCLDVLPHLSAGCVDMVCADLPYGTTRCEWDSLIDLSRLWPEYDRVTRENAAVVLTAQTPFDKVLGCSRLDLLRYEWIWEKTEATGHLNAKRMPMKAHENVLVFYRSLPTYNPIKTTGHARKSAVALRHADGSDVYGQQAGVTSYDSTDRYPRSVLTFSTDKQTTNLHSTQKPLGLIAYLIQTYTNPGDLVLDNTMGSGTAVVAAKMLGRRAVGIDTIASHCATAVDRLRQGVLQFGGAA